MVAALARGFSPRKMVRAWLPAGLSVWFLMSGCLVDFSEKGGPETCGDGILQEGEECDGGDLGGLTCEQEGYLSGTLSCKSDCTLDLSGCSKCGDGVVDREIGESCDDGNRVSGDGCSASCQDELDIFPGFVEVRDGEIFVRGDHVVLMGADGLARGGTEEELLDAGFNFLTGPGLGGFRGLFVPGDDPQAFIASHVTETNLIFWLGPDEPLWNGLTTDQVTSGWLAPLADADQYHRPLFLKHAPRGSREDPGNLDLLLPYLALSDIVAMDMYPVPDENGVSIMAGAQGLAAVGVHAQWLANSMRSLAHDGAEVMVLQAAGLGRIPNERWEMAEFWQEIPAESAWDVRFAVSGDFDADGRDEVVACFSRQQDQTLSIYDFTDRPFGGDVLWHPVTSEFSLDATRVLGTAGDLDGDGDDDLILLMDHGTSRQEVWMIEAGPEGLGAERLLAVFDTMQFSVGAIRYLVSADADGDGCSDLFWADSGGRRVRVMHSVCGGDPGLDLPEIWFVSQQHWRSIDALAAGDVDGDGLADVFLAYNKFSGEGVARILSDGGVGSIEEDVVENDGFFDPDTFVGLCLADLDGDGTQELVLAIDASAGSGQALDVRVRVALGPAMKLDAMDQWLGIAAGLPLLMNSVMAGDWDGDGLDDVVWVRRSQVAGGNMALLLAFSTGSYFGARDPLAVEMWFMAIDAMVRGASGGVIFALVDLLDAQGPAWQSLKSTGQKLSALRSVFQEQTVSRGVSGAFAWWWLQGQGLVHLVVAHEERSSAGQELVVPLPREVSGGTLLLWNMDEQRFDDSGHASMASGALIDSDVFGPYEVRVYQIAP